MSKDWKIDNDDWKEAVILKTEKDMKASQLFHFLLKFYKENKDKTLSFLDENARSSINRISELENQLNEMKIAKQEPCVELIAVPESLKERIEQMILEKHGEVADRNEEALDAWRTWVEDYEVAKRNFAKVRELTGNITGDELNELETANIFNYEKAVLAAFIRHGFVKRLASGKFELLK